MNPCGVGIGKSIEFAFQNAFDADNQSIFGGIIALNRAVTAELAQTLHSIFLEVVIAPKFTDEAARNFDSKEKYSIIRNRYYD